MPYGRPIEITDPQTARELDAFPLISLEILEGSLDGTEVVAYADYSINELRSIAKQLGIEIRRRESAQLAGGGLREGKKRGSYSSIHP